MAYSDIRKENLMQPMLNGLSADPINAGLRQLFQALAAGPAVRAQHAQQQALLGAQMEQATSSAHKAAIDAHAADYAQQQREQAMQGLAARPDAQGYEKNLLLLMQLLGNQANPTTLTQGALHAQKGQYRQRVLNQYSGDRDRSTVGFLNAFLEGKPHEPYSGLGTTGYALNRETGQGLLVAPALAAHMQTASPRKHYDAEYGRIIDLDRNIATPVTTEKGEPIATRAQNAAHRAQNALAGSMAQLDRLAAAAQEVKDHPALSRITGAMGRVPNFPGSAASDLEARLHNLKTQVGFAALQAMRDASKTGGALGNVSNFEVQSLQNSLASLEHSQSAAAMQASLQHIMEYVQQTKGRLHQAMQEDYPQQEAEPARPISKEIIPEGIPVEAIEHLKRHPHLRGAFDEHYGLGSAAQVLGS
jgi:hypothetical protein